MLFAISSPGNSLDAALLDKINNKTKPLGALGQLEQLALQIGRMEKTDAAVAEYSIALNYVETLLSLPWNAMTRDNLDLAQAAEVFDGSITDLYIPKKN